MSIKIEIFDHEIQDLASLNAVACAIPYAARQANSAEAILALRERASAIGGCPKRLARIKRMCNKVDRGATDQDLSAMAATWRKHQLLNGNTARY